MYGTANQQCVLDEKRSERLAQRIHAAQQEGAIANRYPAAA